MAATFHTTQWTLILRAATSQTHDGLAALDQLCRRYWKPLHAYACTKASSTADADDLTQAFFQRLLANKLHLLADEKRGRFRTFLLRSLQNFIRNEHRDASRQKRGGPDVLHVDVSEVSDELASADTPELLYDQKWAQAVVAAAIEQLRLEYTASGHPEYFTILRPLLSSASTGDANTMAAELGVTLSNFRKILHCFRRSFGNHLRQEVRRLVADPADVDDEIAYLMRVLGA